MAVLEGCTIKFYTNGKRKEADSSLTVTVRDESGVVAASASGAFGYFEEQSNNGPFDLALLHASEKADLRRGSVTLRLEPSADEAWRFNFFTVLAFSDGTRLSGGELDLQLDTSRNEQTFRLESIFR